ncbi:hypothetical protein AcW1_002786 [Taiwanofungus camphoratus]|nr:hypothetical protein AcV5_009540 [Antrodia cinnamomea]KAI0943061.1 hypothetical protein AcV7_002306 [Antrodia cinnamomea]KAI0943689.1 hypothetical protein AcW1_002786 [Antrodia cinnamomea]
MGTRNLNSSNNNRHGACNVLPCKMVCVEWKPLGEFRHSLELVKTIVEALDCHRRYYEAGFLHGNICPANIVMMDFDGRESNRENEARMWPWKGILLDLDKSNKSMRFLPGKSRNTKEKCKESEPEVSANDKQ